MKLDEENRLTLANALGKHDSFSVSKIRRNRKHKERGAAHQRASLARQRSAANAEGWSGGGGACVDNKALGPASDCGSIIVARVG